MFKWFKQRNKIKEITNEIPWKEIDTGSDKFEYFREKEWSRPYYVNSGDVFNLTITETREEPDGTVVETVETISEVIDKPMVITHASAFRLKEGAFGYKDGIGGIFGEKK